MRDRTIKYPATRRQDIVDDYHGITVADPYRWLEDDNSPETARWVAAQNEVAFRHLSEISFRGGLRERLTQLWNYPKEGIPQKEGGWFYFSRNDGLQNQAVVYRTNAIGGKEEVFLDPNKLSVDGTVALGGMSFSRDGRLCAYSVSSAGSDWTEIRILDAETMTELPDVIKWVKFSVPAWSADSQGFYYSAYEPPSEGSHYSGQNRFHKVFFHRLGQPQAEDTLIYGDPEHPLRYFHGEESRDGRYIFINGSEGTHGTEILFRDIRHPDEGFKVLLPGFGSDYEIVHTQGDKIYLFTNEGAPNSRLAAVDLTDPEAELATVIPEKEETPMESVTFAGGYFFAVYIRDAASEVEQYDMQGRFLTGIPLKGLGSVAGFRGEADDTETFYSVATYTSPPEIHRYDIASRSSERLSVSAVNFDSGLYETCRMFFQSMDGTRVPLFMVCRKDMRPDGNNPLLMYGYGGFNISHGPVFNPSVVAFLEQGGIFVDVILRGGGEYGEKWHRDGMLENKHNVFDDFIAAAEFLITEKYTSPEKLAIMGGSNGGLLVGACMTLRPDLFAVAVPQVGVLDMLRYHRFTIGWGWMVEYGDPDNPSDFGYIYEYSPLHNIVEGMCYPATLITTADHDDRVVPAHSFKFAAALQYAQGCANPILLRVDTDAGHGAGKPTAKRIEEASDVYSFILYHTGAKVEL